MRPAPSPADCWTAIEAATRTLPESGEPPAAFAVVEAALQRLIGARLFTILRVLPDGSTQRVHTSDPAGYPVAGRKARNPTPWYEQVVSRGQAYVGPTPADVRAAFFDHELIARLGCGSVLNLPVRWAGQTLGVVNMLHEEGWYGPAHAPAGLPFASLLAPAFLSPQPRPAAERDAL